MRRERYKISCPRSVSVIRGRRALCAAVRDLSRSAPRLRELPLCVVNRACEARVSLEQLRKERHVQHCDCGSCACPYSNVRERVGVGVGVSEWARAWARGG
eukprot:2280176-Pleurochrysis_carterae.AAC.1